jgi:hypothetical protein
MAINREDSYFQLSGSKFEDQSYLTSFYSREEGNYIDIPLPSGVTGIDADGNETMKNPSPRKATQSIFNRYSLFYYNSMSLSSESEGYLDKPNRLEDAMTPHKAHFKAQPAQTDPKTGKVLNPGYEATDQEWTPGGVNGIGDVLTNPTASNLVNWSSQGNGDPRLGTNAVEYAWEDFLWCKNYGIVPNNYMVTLRRFDRPVTDDLLDYNKIGTPDISRMITWVDGESNTWESAGLKFSSSIKWKEIESEIQTQNGDNSHTSQVNEGAAVEGQLPKIGGLFKSLSWLTQKKPSSPPGAFAPNEYAGGPVADPYANANKTFGPLDVIKKMMIRDKGLEFEQTFTLKFEYELRSIDGINPKVAMIDLISNVFLMTANRGEFWGGDIRYFNGGGGGGNASKAVTPIGDPKKLLAGDYTGYFKSFTDGIKERFSKFTGGEGFTKEGIGNAIKGFAGNLLSNTIGGALDGTPGGGNVGAQALNSLLTGEETGHWHVMVGNPARPIISVGNLILQKSEYSLHGPVGNDDFPSKLTVICTLVPARPRDRSDMIAMFHRGGRTYTTIAPGDKKYSGAKKTPGVKKTSTNRSVAQEKQASFNNQDAQEIASLLEPRFQNHKNVSAILVKVAEGIY